jgi:hypothetical protein
MAISSGKLCVDDGRVDRGGCESDEGVKLGGLARVESIDDRPRGNGDHVPDHDVGNQQDGCPSAPAIDLDDGTQRVDIDDTSRE